MIPDLLLAIVLLGLPLVLLSWFLFEWLFASGEISPDADRKALSAQLKKARRKISRQERSNTHYVYDKWMWFGSGFYGLAGLWTFAVIEITQLIDFLVNFPGWRELTSGGLVDFLIDFALNQLGNMLQGLVWFSWWPADSTLVWILVAYLGYWCGVELARRGIAIPVAGLYQWLLRLKSGKARD